MDVIPASQFEAAVAPAYEDAEPLDAIEAFRLPLTRRVPRPHLHRRRRERIQKDLPIVLAEGDSWLAFPLGRRGNIVDWLRNIGRGILVVEDEASSGDEAVAMLSGDAKLRLLDKRLRRNDFDILLFSGGGNDIVGKYDMPYFLRKREQADRSWRDVFLQERFDRRLAQVRNAYLDLVELAMEFSVNKHLRLVTHTYDIAVPSPRGVEVLFGLYKSGPWMYPHLVEKEIHESEWQEAIARHMLTSFATMLHDVADHLPDYVAPHLSDRAAGRLTVVSTQGTLQPDREEDWRDEIHPSSDGFRRITERIWNEGVIPNLEGLRRAYQSV